MSDNRTLEKEKEKADYNSLVAAINSEYCKKHNYDFIYYRPYLNNSNIITLYNCVDPNTKTLRHASWAKQLSTSLALKLNYDYVAYIDSDCIFKDFNHKLENLITFFNDKELIFLNNKPWGDRLPCGGFYIAKVCDHSTQFFIDWYNVNLPKYNKKHAWEQDALWYIYLKFNIVVVDTWMFREKEGQFLRHVGSCDEDKSPNHRINYFTKFINDNNINYEMNINNIKCIDYNTNKNAITFEHPITNKIYSWCDGKDKIKFLEDNEMEAFGWGYYNQIDSYTFKACFGEKEYTLRFNEDYSEFISLQNNNIKGNLL